MVLDLIIPAWYVPDRIHDNRHILKSTDLDANAMGSDNARVFNRAAQTL